MIGARFGDWANRDLDPSRTARYRVVERQMLLAAIVPVACLTVAILMFGGIVRSWIDPASAVGVLGINGVTALATIVMVATLRVGRGRRHLEALVATWSLLVIIDLFAVGLVTPHQREVALHLLPFVPLLFALFIPVRPVVQALQAAAASVGIIALAMVDPAGDPLITVAMAIFVGPVLSVLGGILLRRQRIGYVASMLGARRSSRVATERGRALDLLYREQAMSARRDPLTGVGNRLGMNEEFDRLEGASRPASLLLLDVDEFKLYNDTHGHVAGDDALRRIADVLAASIREGDKVFRYGGEEFLLVLPETGVDRAKLIAERLRLAVAAVPLTINDTGRSARLKVSIGLAVHHASEGGSLLQTLASADTALYRAKRAGRDRIEVHPGTTTAAPISPAPA